MTTDLERASVAVLVLANLMDADLRLNDQSRARLDRAVSLWRDTPDAVFVTSGWAYRTDSKTPISAVMAAEAVKLGVNGERILQNRRARDTVGDAVFFGTDILARLPALRQVIVVTSEYHGPRTDEIFRTVLPTDLDVTTRVAASPGNDAYLDSEEASIAAFRRSFEGVPAHDPSAFLERLLSAHPFYNGEIYAPEATSA
ncbi:DUF218 domain-containing protein [Tranquillimonas rosea]|uniref:DUF218 domain-containing protein n=1 Tax=Tranquillimonas rosea TaxID=641238 RepID=A0A1H9UYC2_9RHOB|nr:YdcF family protein [Tranquillimonas rosea]SES14349.1 DUF218 domain-containing protein [Tranquillimonas rosea]